jgi:tetratricopeptide (TPR) repeat protein
MNEKLKKAINAGLAIDRANVLLLLQSALGAGEPRFVRELSEDWLNAFPYDLPIELIRANALVKEGKNDKAFKILSRLVELDPECLEAQTLLASVARRVKPGDAEQARAAAAVLSAPGNTADVQAWGMALMRAKAAMAAAEWEQAEGEVQAALLSDPPSALPAIMHVRLYEKQGLTWLAISNLVELYRSQWPHALYFRLMDAAQRMESGREDEALDILHDCAAEDVSAQVARRMWGANHRFAAIWPRSLSHIIETPIPAGVAASLGWNQLPHEIEERIAKSVPQVEIAPIVESKSAPVAAGKSVEITPIEDISPVTTAESKGEMPTLRRPKVQRAAKPKATGAYVDELGVEYQAKTETAAPKLTPTETPIDLEDIGTDTEDLRLRADGRYPAYIMLSSRAALESQYGPEGFRQIDEALKNIAEATKTLEGWNSHVIYADDKDTLSQFGLLTVKADDPWEVKHLLTDLDEALRKKSEMIGAVMIVGGPQIIPFHNLPNPVDDEDKDVPSDNPYASIDENYFVPTWALGRLPNGEGADPTTFLKALNKIAGGRGKNLGPVDSLDALITRILIFFGIWRPKRSSFGYSAEIWRRASHSVYRTIGEPRDLSISPPTGTGGLPQEARKALQVAYFNLHGLAETAEWYGQRDPQTTPDGPDYPVALRPSDIINSGRAPQVVFTEACFGAHIYNKTVDNALSLKFLDSGSKAVVGSTVTSYGSVTTPLIAADLLGQIFWKLLNEGYPVGEALRRAKIAMAQTMHRRQGYLDGEDQKTLISFVLYGDPLAQVLPDGTTPKRIMRVDAHASAEVKAICDRTEGHSTPMQDLPAETMATVKSIVAEYLPGMQGSKVSFSHEHVECLGHNCTLPHIHRKAMGLAPTRSLVTLSKKMQSGNQTHPQYARITMDAQGKVVKLAVSR